MANAIKRAQEITDLIDELFSDMTVPASKTLDILQDIRADLDFKIGTLQQQGRTR